MSFPHVSTEKVSIEYLMHWSVSSIKNCIRKTYADTVTLVFYV